MAALRSVSAAATSLRSPSVAAPRVLRQLFSTSTFVPAPISQSNMSSPKRDPSPNLFVSAAVAAIAAATAASSGFGEDQEMARTDMAVDSTATLVAAQCVEAAEAVGAERDHLAVVVSSAVNVRSSGDIMTLTAAAATALRGAATLKARTLKEVWNIAAVIPMEKGVAGGGNGRNGSTSIHSDELVPEENFLGICSRELLARGCELLKRTRTGDLHWKIVSIYVNQMNQEEYI